MKLLNYLKKNKCKREKQNKEFESQMKKLKKQNKNMRFVFYVRKKL